MSGLSFIISSFFALLPPSQNRLPQVFLFQPLTIFQCFRPLGPSHPQLHLPEFFPPISLTLAHPSDRNSNVSSWERTSLTDHLKLLCTSFSVMALYSLLSRPSHKLCVRFFSSHSSQCLLQFLHVVGSQSRCIKGMRGERTRISA